jgi:tripartite-type tricarboxylate transporter receptor subunit TctC
VLILTLLALSISPLSHARQPETYRIVVPFSAGGTTDVTARILAEAISQHTGNPVVVENRPGGFTTVALEYVMRQPADGRTLFIAANGVTTHRYYLPNTNVDPITQLSVVSMIVESPMVLLVSNKAEQVPRNNLSDFVNYARRNPGLINYASVGQGGTLQMAADLFLNVTNTNMVSIPYSGGAPAAVDFVAGRLQMMFDSTALGMRAVNANTARALAVTSTYRSRLAPDVPTFRELGYNIDFVPWQAVFVSAATPEPARYRLNSIIRRSLQNPSIVQKYMEAGMERVLGTNVFDSEALLSKEANTWRQIFRPN